LMLLHDARRDGRLTGDGDIVQMRDQDRGRWDTAQIADGRAHLESALSRGAAGPYQIQAAIAALHAEAPTSGDTDWAQIAALYGRLLELTGSPVVALNRAVAVAESDGPQAGLDLIGALEHSLRDYLWLHTTRGELLARLARPAEARECYERALTLARNAAQTRFVECRLVAL
jgi:RNA polymerase sigma-70 factor, ECF subfamily